MKIETAEMLTCAESPAYFLHTYGQIYDATLGQWVPFHLWPAQMQTLKMLVHDQLSIALKARQLGLTWLALGYALWKLLFHPIATALIFSKRDDEAVYLLGEERLRGMYARLPAWMQARAVVGSNVHEFKLSNGSVARAFPTTAGDSYTATLAIVDEADLVPDLGKLLRAVKPTIDGGGQMFLLSRPDKSKPESEFKKIYRAAKQGRNDWGHIFLPWNARPDRDELWYARQRADIYERTGSLDDLHEQYPATDTEALAPRSLDKRIASLWLEACYRELTPQVFGNAPAIRGLEIYVEPQAGKRYVLGIDPAEGNPTSDPSAIEVLDFETGEEMAALAGRIQPTTLAAHAKEIAAYFNNASAMVERNNHGHLVISWLRDNSKVKLHKGWDDKDGWLDNSRGKNELYDRAADAFREKNALVHSFTTFTQLASVDGSTLRAPEGEHDDRADGYALANVARTGKPARLHSGRVDWYGGLADNREQMTDARTPAEIDVLLAEAG